jgi:hypothetical protein
MSKMEESVQKIWDEIGDSFDKVRNDPIKMLFPRTPYNNVLILAHGDLDGIGSGLAIYDIIKDNARNVEKLFTLPHRIGEHVNTDVYDLVILADIAINNRSVEMAFNFIKKNHSKMVWIDHHYLSRNLRNRLKNYPHVLIERRKSCIEYIRELFPWFNWSRKVRELMEYGHLTDQGYGSNIYNKALKVNLRAEETRDEIWRWATKLTCGEEERWCYERLKYKEGRYIELEANSQHAIDKLGIFHNKIAIVDIINYSQSTVDKTLIPFLLYGDYDVVVTKYLEKKRKDSNKDTRKLREYLTISVAPKCRLNLLKVFNLESGAEFRITIENKNKANNKKYTNEELIKKIEDGLSRL